MALTSVTLHLEKTTSYCGAAHLQALKGNMALDTPSLYHGKFSVQQHGLQNSQCSKKAYKQLDYSEYVAEHVFRIYPA